LKIYLAGPMSGLPLFNFPAFLVAAEKLRMQGHEVLSPAEACLAEGFNPSNPGEITKGRYERWMLRAFGMIAEADAVCFLPGWLASSGAVRERIHAVGLRKRLLVYEEDGAL
jgi:hypothetical protein